MPVDTSDIYHTKVCTCRVAAVMGLSSSRPGHRTSLQEASQQVMLTKPFKLVDIRILFYSTAEPILKFLQSASATPYMVPGCDARKKHSWAMTSLML